MAMFRLIASTYGIKSEPKKNHVEEELKQNKEKQEDSSFKGKPHCCKYVYGSKIQTYFLQQEPYRAAGYIAPSLRDIIEISKTNPQLQ